MGQARLAAAPFLGGEHTCAPTSKAVVGAATGQTGSNVADLGRVLVRRGRKARLKWARLCFVARRRRPAGHGPHLSREERGWPAAVARPASRTWPTTTRRLSCSAPPDLQGPIDASDAPSSPHPTKEQRKRGPPSRPASSSFSQGPAGRSRESPACGRAGGRGGGGKRVKAARAPYSNFNFIIPSSRQTRMK